MITTLRRILVVVVCLSVLKPVWAERLQPIPNRIVVLTFDDASKSHFTVARPVLKQYGFGATFFITEGFDFATNKTDYMTWEEIAQLHRDGFEIGNHTKTHMAVTQDNLASLADELKAIDQQCSQNGIPKPVSFAYPGNAFTVDALRVLETHGIRYARRGAQPEYKYETGKGVAYQPGFDHPLLIPTTGDARPTWDLEQFRAAIEQGKGGDIAVLQFHGVPDTAHAWVNTSSEKFKQFMKHLHDHDYTVIALRDLSSYVPAGCVPNDPEMIIKDRQRLIKLGQTPVDYRSPKDRASLRKWLENMVVYHQFSTAEIVSATGLSSAEIAEALKEFNLKDATRPHRSTTQPLTVLPYPGGRHPRIGFRDGEIRPQRETKCSVFTPWNESDYVVIDIPEAVWHDTADGPKLLYLAHTHIPTVWDERGIELPQLEWQPTDDGGLTIERSFPNDIKFGATVTPSRDAVRMKLWLHNGTSETLRGLRVQNCIMLARATGFAAQDNQNKLFRPPYAVCRNENGTRWIITAWQPCQRTWGNADCPCLHSDPQFPDCQPGQTQELMGWLSFYEGTEIEQELQRIADTQWEE
jgi:peptidoglycan/xylan/chitin deacetylase (PgdA/CDA1 family)